MTCETNTIKRVMKCCRSSFNVKFLIGIIIVFKFEQCNSSTSSSNSINQIRELNNTEINVKNVITQRLRNSNPVQSETEPRNTNDKQTNSKLKYLNDDAQNKNLSYYDNGKSNFVVTISSNHEGKANRTFIPDSERKSASFIPLYIIICMYSFLGITVTCHRYFVKSMSKICEDLKISEDIVGATFMAAGSSAPELATVLIAVFFTKDDIGISDVIGSAVFNMLFVTALCGLFTNTALHLNWWPLIRNCFFYTVSIMIMLIAIANKQVSWLESSLLISGYILYCVALYYNELLEAWANTIPFPFNKMQNEDIKETDADYIPLEDRKLPTYAPTTERYSIVQSNGRVITSIQQTYQGNKTGSGGLTSENDEPTLPTEGSILDQFKYYCISPVYFVCRMTIPDWQDDKFHNLYLLTFLVSFIWISVYSYIMIWMITIIGEILQIPSTVMGLTLVAAGVSVPDAVTSLNVVKQGYADMALSNAIGSNIFDVLICLGVPWFLQTAIIQSGSYVKVCSEGMVYSTVLLFSTVVLLITAIHRNGWKLDRKIGIVLMIGYAVFITIATVYELFGYGRRGC